MSLEELSESFKRDGLKAFRAAQVYEWLTKGAESFDEMTNLSKDLRSALSEKYFVAALKIRKKYVSKIDGTVKYLFELSDGRLIESVVMKYKHGFSQCLSTQAGCRMNCSFCATGKGGLERNLLPSEILSQITAAQKDLSIRISNIVLMGMGEPLDNFDNTVKFLRLVMQITLSISLHCPLDSVRSSLMPINKKWNVDSLMKACREYTNKTGRRISFEYIIIDGVNNTDECLFELKRLLSGMIAHVNLIPANPVKGSSSKGTRRAAEEFRDRLLKNGINATVRRTLGADIEASCGQLKGKEKQ